MNKKLCAVTALGLTTDRTKDGYGYKYAPLDVVIDKLKKPLEKAGLGYYFTLDGASIHISVVDLDKGDIIQESMFPILDVKSNQDLGKAITYGKRYLLKTVFNVSEVDDPDDEDNGNFIEKAKTLNNNKQPNTLPKKNFF